jgi:hypothetical protein
VLGSAPRAPPVRTTQVIAARPLLDKAELGRVSTIAAPAAHAERAAPGQHSHPQPSMPPHEGRTEWIQRDLPIRECTVGCSARACFPVADGARSEERQCRAAARRKEEKEDSALPNGWPLSCGRHGAYHGRPTPGNPDQHRGSVALTCSAVSFSGVVGLHAPRATRSQHPGDRSQAAGGQGRTRAGPDDGRPSNAGCSMRP